MTTYAEHPAAGSPDGLLVRAYLNGDSSAFDTLYTRYFPFVLRYVQARVGDYLTAEDLAQEAMTRALDRLDGFDQTRPFLPYVYKIAYRLLPAHWQRESVERPVDEFRDDAVSIQDDSERIVTIRAVTEALARIDKRHRDVLYMRYAEDRDGNELAAFFGLKRNAFEQLLSRARRAMKREYRGPAVLVPGLPGLLARLRRFGTTAGARLQVASGATASMAGELAIGAAITVGGITLVIQGAAPDAADDRVARTVAVAGDRGVIAYERGAPDLYSGLPRGATGDTVADRPRTAGTLPGDALATGAEGWDGGVPDDAGTDASAGEVGAGDVPADGGRDVADPGGGGSSVPGAHASAPLNAGEDRPDGTVHVGAPNVNAPAPETTVYVDPDSESGAAVESEETQTSGQVALNRQIAENGEIASEAVQTQVGDVPVGVKNETYTNDFDACYELMLC